jgi:hypothetical protein
MCDRECDCRTCLSASFCGCGECYTDSLERCRAGGIHNCRGYVPRNIFKRIFYKIMGRSSK